MIEVYLDESHDPTSGRTFAGAVAFEHSRSSTETEIERLYNELVGESFYLDGVRGFEKFRKRGFHATDDTLDIACQFVRVIGGIAGAKLFIELSDHSARPDLTIDQTYALLYLRLTELILRKYIWADEMQFVFEQHPTLSKRYAAIVSASVKRTHFKGRALASSKAKEASSVLAVADYGLVLYLRAHQEDSLDWQRRHWQAVRPLVSSVRSMDSGETLLRRGPAPE